MSLPLLVLVLRQRCHASIVGPSPWSLLWTCTLSRNLGMNGVIGVSACLGIDPVRSDLNDPPGLLASLSFTDAVAMCGVI
jgi:hypothetical protein